MAKGSVLQREIKQKRPFHSLGQEATLGLIHTADLIRRRIAAAIAPFGITTQQYNVLRILRGAGRSGLPTLEIAARLVEQTPGITRLLDRIERKGWARRERCAEDRRQVLCFITPQGLRLLGKMDQPVAVADDAVMELLDADGKRALIALLDTVRGAGT